MDFDRNYIMTGTGRPLIFQHGLGADARQAQGLMAGLDEMQVISMDCPGHGQSPLPAGYTPSFTAYVDDVIRLMDHLGIERALFGGISMGAGISIQIALRFPERVEGLLLVRPAWLAQGRPANLEILMDLVDYLDTPDGEARFAETQAFRQIQQELPAAAASIAGMFSRMQQAATPQIIKHLVADAPFADEAQLVKIAHPCLLVGNGDDPLHPGEMAAEIAAKIPNSSLKTVTSRYVDAAKHRQEVRDHVLTFLAKN